jgi:hypothetical protein
MARRFVTACVVLLCSISEVFAYGQTSGSIVELQGFVVSRNGETLTIRTAQGDDILVVLNAITRVVVAPVTGFHKNSSSVTSLVPGLVLTVQGTRNDDGRLIANTVELAGHGLNSNKAEQEVAPATPGRKRFTNGCIRPVASGGSRPGRHWAKYVRDAPTTDTGRQAPVRPS